MSWRIYHFFEADEVDLRKAKELYANGELIFGKVQLQARIRFPEVRSLLRFLVSDDEYQKDYKELVYGCNAELMFSFVELTKADDVKEFFTREFERVVKHRRDFKDIIAEHDNREYVVEVDFSRPMDTPVKLLHLKEVF